MYNMKLDFILENNIVPDDINRVFASYMKHSLEMYNEDLYKKLYKDEHRIIKSYTFCTKMHSLKFQNGFIFLANNSFSVELTDYNFSELIELYNAFLKQKKLNQKYSMNRNSMILKRISLLPLKMPDEKDVIIKMESPLVVRYIHDGLEEYLTLNDDKFEEVLNLVTEQMLISLGFNNPKIHIAPLKVKKTVMNLYKHKANASLGFFKITADPLLISVLLQTGIGSRRSIGAGKFKIIG
ncbi:MAG: hypothetical protein KHZ15_01535 [Coprobacillus cateniformis]|uniref:CRISPR-associated endoribonuclease Cas6 n=1 Tax=Longibaculum muris TaxID=1796628 RepID=UPI003AB4533E|nr:hypothetical protein [Coprobacillus cateniformis]